MPARSTRPDQGLVLCYPAGHEYIRCHRAFRQLAVRSARAGFVVLRFDYFGCGDSEGEYERARVGDWLGDIGLAMDQVKEQRSRVSLVGKRLGATLGAIAAAERGGVERMILWDPVVNGQNYLDGLWAYHQKHMRELEVDQQLSSGGSAGGDVAADLVGYPLAAGMEADLASLDLLGLQRAPAQDVLILQTGSDQTENDRLANHLRQLGARVEVRSIPGQCLWTQSPYQAMVPHQTLQLAVSWLDTDS